MKSLAQLCCEQHAEILPAHILQMPEIRELLDRTLSTWNQLCLFGEIHEYDSKTGLPVRVSKCHTDEYNCTWETNWTINWETRVVHYTHNALDRQAKLDIKFDIDASNSTYVIKSVEHMVGRGTGFYVDRTQFYNMRRGHHHGLSGRCDGLATMYELYDNGHYVGRIRHNAGDLD